MFNVTEPLQGLQQALAIKLAPLSLTILYWTRKHELTLLL